MFDRRRWAGVWLVSGAAAVAVSCDGDTTSMCALDASGSCSGLFTLLVVPAQTTVGSSVALTAAANPSADGGPLALAWSAPSGSLSDASAAGTSFTCTAPGLVTVTFTATFAVCTESLSAVVDCLADAGPGSD